MLTYFRRLTPALVFFLAACGSGEQPVTTQSKKSADDITYQPIIQQMYAGYFGRPADIEGMVFFEAQFRAANAPMDVRSLSAQYQTNPAVRALVDAFAASQESKDLYPGDEVAFLTKIYRQNFGREPDPAGLAFWSNAISQGYVTRASAVLSIMAGASGTDMLLMEKKVVVALQFTHSLPNMGQEYAGMDSNQLARDMLSMVTLETNLAQFQRTIDLVIGNVIALRSGYAEVAAADRKIALIAGADQTLVNTERIAALAVALASDLNTRRTKFGPRWGVEVLPAGATAAAVREQVKGFAGAILIGRVPVPIQFDIVGNEDAPALDPLRVPYCPNFSFDASGNRLNPTQDFRHANPLCRNGITVSVLRGRSVQNGLADIAAKLEQMTAYHAASDAANLQWEKQYTFVEAIWGGGGERVDPILFWEHVPLFSSWEIAYTTTGRAAARRAAFIDCLAINQEVCGFNGHGASQLIDFEGPGIPGVFYSNDSDVLFSNTLASIPVKAKFVNMVSCSTQNFLPENSFGTTLLAVGKTLLTMGMTQVTAVSSSVENYNVNKYLAHLNVGATFADAFAGSMDGTPMAFQGDPYISLRPVPSGRLPKMVIDGHHYNEGQGMLAVNLPDSIGSLKSTKTITIRNVGNADLKIRLTMMNSGMGVDGAMPAFGMWAGQGFALDSPVVTTTSGNTDLGDVELVVKPGASRPITYSLAPVLGNGVTKVNGAYSAVFEIISNDPASFHIFLEMRGTAR